MTLPADPPRITPGLTPGLRIVTLYPELMDVYADRGNTIALAARARAFGLAPEVVAVGLGDPLPEVADLVLIGGGQDREQRLVAPELAAHAARLRQWAAEDTAFLAVCGGYQLFGHWYRTGAGEELPGAGLLDVTTVAPPPGAERCIGDVVADAAEMGIGELVGFENHAGRTYLGPGATPFAFIEYGFGNNGLDGTEGAVHRQVVGTYLHGPLLPKNPRLADRLLLAALRHRYGQHAVFPRPAGDDRLDEYARRAHAAAALVARRRGHRREE